MKQSKHTTFIHPHTVAKTPLQQAFGLMFRPKQGMLFIFSETKKYPIHMLFVFYPIWAIWLDENKTIIDIKKAYPFMPYIAHKGNAAFLFETPFPHSVKIGEKLDWHEHKTK